MGGFLNAYLTWPITVGIVPAMTEATTWARLLKTKRAERGINQTDLADLIGVTRQAVSMWESTAASAWPKPEHVRYLVNELDITDAELAAVYRGGSAEPEAVA